MDYKKLIEELRFLSGHVPEEMCDDDGKDALEKAADAIGTLLEERAQLVKWAKEFKCLTCKHRDGKTEEEPCVSCANSLYGCRDSWEWRFPLLSESEKEKR